MKFSIFFFCFSNTLRYSAIFRLSAGIWGQTIDLNFFIQNLSNFKNKYWFLMLFLKKKLQNASKKILRQQVFLSAQHISFGSGRKQLCQLSLLLLVPSLIQTTPNPSPNQRLIGLQWALLSSPGFILALNTFTDFRSTNLLSAWTYNKGK